MGQESMWQQKIDFLWGRTWLSCKWWVVQDSWWDSQEAFKYPAESKVWQRDSSLLSSYPLGEGQMGETEGELQVTEPLCSPIWDLAEQEGEMIWRNFGPRICPMSKVHTVVLASPCGNRKWHNCKLILQKNEAVLIHQNTRNTESTVNVQNAQAFVFSKTLCSAKCLKNNLGKERKGVEIQIFS